MSAITHDSVFIPLKQDIAPMKRRTIPLASLDDVLKEAQHLFCRSATTVPAIACNH